MPHDGVHWRMDRQAMTAKLREYRARAAQHEERARKTRRPKDREWQTILARAYRMLAEAEVETVARPQPAAV
jgi:hypothetical protein